MSRKSMLADLARSGIGERHATTMKVRFLSAKDTEALGHFNAPSYLIPYFTKAGKLVKEYWRVRYLETPTGPFGAQMAKSPRYSGPAGVRPYAYFSPVRKWGKAFDKDTTKRIIWTEGEKKGTAGCTAGEYAIAIGGVEMFQSQKRGFDFLPELDEIDHNGRDEFICFDSDKASNVNILRAQNVLARRLIDRGARVFIVDLPEFEDGEKTGLDDFLVRFKTAKKREKAISLLFSEDYAEEYELSRDLWDFQDEIAFIKKRGAVWVIEQRALVKDTGRLAKLDFGNRTYTEPAAHEDAKPKEVNTFESWLKWPQRRAHTDIVYEPGQPEILDDNSLNIWPGWGTEPSEGDIKPIVDLVEYLFTNELDLMSWFWRWLAYPIQYPGTKLYSAAVLHGKAQGTGKTFLGEVVGDIYGKNFQLLSSSDLTRDHNETFNGRQFILADEILSGKTRAQADKMKGFITQQSITINPKFQALYTIRDSMNWYFTSNHFDAIYMERGDRRYAVCAVPEIPLTNKFYTELRRWRNNGGAAALHDHLLHVKLGDFEPYSKPPETASHRDMVEASYSELDQWCEDLKNAPDRILQMHGIPATRDLWEPAELLLLCDPERRRSVSAIALGNALKRAGFVKRTVHSPKENASVRLWAVRDVEKWRKAAPGAWAKSFDGHTPQNRREKLT